jgi:hypothetical protein
VQVKVTDTLLPHLANQPQGQMDLPAPDLFPFWPCNTAKNETGNTCK